MRSLQISDRRVIIEKLINKISQGDCNTDSARNCRSLPLIELELLNLRTTFHRRSQNMIWSSRDRILSSCGYGCRGQESSTATFHSRIECDCINSSSWCTFKMSFNGIRLFMHKQRRKGGCGFSRLYCTNLVCNSLHSQYKKRPTSYSPSWSLCHWEINWQ